MNIALGSARRPIFGQIARTGGEGEPEHAPGLDVKGRPLRLARRIPRDSVLVRPGDCRIPGEGHGRGGGGDWGASGMGGRRRRTFGGGKLEPEDCAGARRGGRRADMS